jgi:hypothetical protein
MPFLSGNGSNKPLTNKDKWVIALLSGLLFLLIASPFLFSVVNGVTSSFGLHIANANGCPNLGGLLLHAIVFILVVRLLMR